MTTEVQKLKLPTSIKVGIDYQTGGRQHREVLQVAESVRMDYDGKTVEVYVPFAKDDLNLDEVIDYAAWQVSHEAEMDFYRRLREELGGIPSSAETVAWVVTYIERI